MIIKENYRDEPIIIDSKHVRIIMGENEYNLSETDNGELEILKSEGEFDGTRRNTELTIRPRSSNVIAFK
jgi:hypothetical protein